jgi:hypothetical protein
LGVFHALKCPTLRGQGVGAGSRPGLRISASFPTFHHAWEGGGEYSPSPGGTTGNSPGIHAWGRVVRSPSPGGAAEIPPAAKSVPGSSLRWRASVVPPGLRRTLRRFPSTEAAGLDSVGPSGTKDASTCRTPHLGGSGAAFLREHFFKTLNMAAMRVDDKEDKRLAGRY